MTTAKKKLHRQPEAVANLIRIPEKVRVRAVKEPEYDCQECQDRGWKCTDDAWSVRPCDCQRPDRNVRLLRSRLLAAGLKAREIRAAFAQWDDNYEPEPQWAIDWLGWTMTGGEAPESLRDETRPEGPSGWCLSLFGPTGVGKTMCSAKIARAYIEAGGRDLMWTSVRTLYRDVQRQKGQDGWSSLEIRLEQAELVVMDELGAVRRGSRADEELDWWDARLSERERGDLSTVINSNAEGPDDFDPRVASRLAAGYYRLLTGPDRRDG